MARPLNIAISGDGTLEIDTIAYGTVRGYCRDTSLIRVGKCRQITATLAAWKGGDIHIGDRSSINGAQIYAQSSKVLIGVDCMLSNQINIMGYDQHTLVDLESMTALNSDRRDVVIGNHVWVGRGSMILPGVHIGHGAVIGAGAVVSRSVPPQTTVAGNPARVIRENVSWSRASFRVANDVQEYLSYQTSEDAASHKSGG